MALWTALTLSGMLGAALADMPFAGPVFTGGFSSESKTLNPGDIWMVEARVEVRGGSGTLGRVTVRARDLDVTLTDNFRRQKVASVEIGQWGNYIIDTNVEPWNEPGTYTLTLWAEDSDGTGGGVLIDVMRLTVMDPDQIVVHPWKDLSRQAAGEMIEWEKQEEWSDAGRIRYVCQIAGSGRTYLSYWIWGESYIDECTRAAASMAVSYLGLDALPKRWKSDRMSDFEAGYNQELGTCIVETDCTKKNFEIMYNHFADDLSCTYSPVILYTRYKQVGREASRHAIVVLGRDETEENLFYVVDPAKPSDIAQIELKSIDGRLYIAAYDGSSAAYNTRHSMISFSQYTR